MKLAFSQRKDIGKNSAKKLQREGKIPAVLYSRGQVGENLSIAERDFSALLREIKKGTLSTTILMLVDGQQERRVLVKDIQYHPTSYRVVHIDFEELHDDVRVNVKVPIEATGVVDCVGIKQGGVLRKVIRQVRVNCLPKDIPACFQLDVKDLNLLQCKRLSNLAIPEGIRLLENLNEVAMVIVKR